MTNLIIIDASGSMSGRVNDVKGGIKQLFLDIKTEDKDPSLFKHSKKKKIQSRTIVVDFSDDFRVLHDVNSADELKDETADNYKTRGSTALYDAIGRGFAMVDEKEEKVFVTIITDGEENASREYSGAKIKELITQKKEKGWAIVFLGTDEACVDAARNIGVSRGNTMTFTGYSGYSGMGGVMGYSGYTGTIGHSRAMYMSSNSALADENLLTSAEAYRRQVDTAEGILNEGDDDQTALQNINKKLGLIKDNS